MWLDTRNGDTVLYAQRLNGAGTVLWNRDGKSLNTRAFREWVGPIVSDGQGGAIIIWRDIVEDRVALRAQLVDSVGNTPWGPEGVFVRVQGSDIEWPRAVQDGAGGVIVVWEDITDTDGYHIRAQRISHEGARTWGDKGMLISSNDLSDHHPGLASDGNGGAIVVWDTYSEEVARAQRLDGDGDLLWDAAGVRVCTGSSSQWYPVACEDASGGVFVIWVDIRAGYTRYIYSQRLDSAGQLQWSPDGVPICMSGGNGYFPGVIGDGVGGAIVVWDDSRNELAGDLYAQRISPEGIVRWTVDGVAVSTAEREQSLSKLASDGQGGVIVCWDDNRERSTSNDVYAQRVDSAGSIGSGSLNEISMTIGVRDRWNLLSVPVAVRDYVKSTLFPTSVTDAYAFEGGYAAIGVLDNGSGYWTKFNDPGEIAFDGLPLLDQQINVSEGWNLIGSLSVPISISQIHSVPPGIQSSQFFGYDGNYIKADSIQPGKGYWVKMQQAGTLVLSASTGGLAAGNRIKIVPTGEMPPSPPGGAADEKDELKPETYDLGQNHPNPFNPTTIIKYQIPNPNYVSLKVYDVLGREVATLVDGVELAGYKSVEWNAATVPSGVYFYRVCAGNFMQTRKMVLVR